MTINAEDVQRRVLACGDVVRLTGGPGGVGTAPPRGRRVEGVRDLDPGVEVHVVARWGFTTAGLTTQVRSALATMVGPIVVVIDDVTTPCDPPAVADAADTTEAETTDEQPGSPGEHIATERDSSDAAVGVVSAPVEVVPVAVRAEVDSVIVVVEVDVAATANENSE